jgi:Transcriptional regulator
MMRKRIIDAAGNLFGLYGIKAVSMDDIATELHISKKTIYENFGDKAGLVFECIRHNAHQGADALESAENNAGSPLELILMTNQIAFGQVMNRCPAFFRDLEAYPEAKLQHFDKYISLLGSKYVRSFFRCREEGLFPEDTDFKMILDFFLEQLQRHTDKHWIGHSHSAVTHFNIIKTFLSGICTDNGRTELSKHNSQESSISKIIKI